jgi:glucose/arabinose dehydrogenase
MKRIAALAVMAAVLTTATSGLAVAGAATPQVSVTPSAPILKAVAVKSGLQNPAGFTFLPDGRVLYGERNSGRVMLLDPTNGNVSVLYTISNVRSNGEQGLLGLAVDPGWPNKPYVYAYATRQVASLQNQILKIKVAGDTGVSHKIIWRLDTTAGTYHDGGHIDFGPDGKLYAVVGEGHNSTNAQDLTVDAGKVLRMNRDGTVPLDNPFAGSLIFTYGLRNSFGFSFDPQSGTLWETENGPECVDEINVEQAGENHAWGPHETCSGTDPTDTNQDGPEPRIMPLRWFTPTIAPTGLAFCQRCGIPKASGSLFFGANNTGEIRQVKLTANRKDVASMSVVLDFPNAVFSMQAAPSGGVYFSTSDTIYHLVQA